MLRKLLTLTIIRNETEVLLGFKKRGFGCGKWNGFGGKVEKGESIVDAAVREVKEECGLHIEKPDKVGIIDFEFVGDPELLEVHIFTTQSYSGDVCESEEMEPRWFSIESIPFDKMWADDRHWLPLLLKGHKFKGYFLFQGHDTILKKDIKMLDNLDA